MSFRASSYDADDTTYATRLSAEFQLLPPDVQSKFQTFTDNLMSEKQINRYCLLKAIDHFSEANDVPEWSQFASTAFNYRPYQSW